MADSSRRPSTYVILLSNNQETLATEPVSGYYEQ